MTRNSANHSQSGNALFMILIGVVLFAALSFTFTRGNQQGADSISKRQAELAASDIITYAQRVSRTVDSMLSKSISETQLSFEGTGTGYANAACLDDNCKVFGSGKYGIQVLNPVDSWIDKGFVGGPGYMVWSVSSQFCIPGLPDNTCSSPRGNDLVLFLPYLKRPLCEMINTQLGLPVPAPIPTMSIASFIPFDGSFSPTGGATLVDHAGLVRKSSGCFYESTSHAYIFYTVLEAR